MATKDMTDAKRQVLMELKKQMMKEDSMGLEKAMPVKKVVVASDSKAGLEEGLSKAQEILKKRKELGLGTEEEPMADDSEEEACPVCGKMDCGCDMESEEGCICGKCPDCLSSKIDNLENKLAE